MILANYEKLDKKLKNEITYEYYIKLKKKLPYLVLKRLGDIFLSLLLLILLFPVFVITAILIKIDSKGAVFYKQDRITKEGKCFKIYKFRTMVNNADKLGELITQKEDNRITNIGKKIRKYRIDEIPQLINIFKGEMTFVGTRPEVEKYVKLYDKKMKATLLLSAGLTSKASIEFKEEDKIIEQYAKLETIDKIYVDKILPLKMKYNIEYLDKIGLIEDIKICFNTVKRIFFKEKKRDTTKKVLFVATVDSHIKQFHINHLKWFKEMGYEVQVATNGKSEIEYCDKKHIISVERNPIKMKNLKAIKELRDIIKSEKFEIIHCHEPMGSVVTRLAAICSRKKGTKVIYTAHGFHFFKGAPIKNWIIFYPIEKILSIFTDCIITINQEDYKLAKKHFYSKQIEIIDGVGIQQEKFGLKLREEEKMDLKNKLGIHNDETVLIYAAELSKRKNQEMLLNVINLLKKDNKNVKLLLPGLDSMKGKYQKKAKMLNIENEVEFLGYRNDVNYLMQIADIAVSTSRQEGLPVNIIEGMMRGIPVIATNCRGNRDLIKDGKNGFLIELDDENAYKEAIERLIQDKNLYNKISKFNEKDSQKYSLKNIMQDLERIYIRNMEEKDVLQV